MQVERDTSRFDNDAAPCIGFVISLCVAKDFARFAEMAKKGHPYMGSMVIEDSPGPKPAQYIEALKEQQRDDLQRSIAYAQKEYGIGINWKKG